MPLLEKKSLSESMYISEMKAAAINHANSASRMFIQRDWNVERAGLRHKRTQLAIWG